MASSGAAADGDGLPSAPLASLSLRVPAPGAAAARSVPPRPAFAVKKPAGGVRPRKGSHGEGCASTSALPADNAYAALQEGGKLQLVRLLSALVAVAGRAVKQTATGNGKGLLKHAALGAAGLLLGARLIPGLPWLRRTNAANPKRAGAMPRAGLVWMRNDLRLHDHEALAAAAAECSCVVPVYCFDPREYGKSEAGFDRTGPSRARFILESLSDLRSRLRGLGSDLVVRMGRPEDVLPQLALAVGAGAVYCHREVTAEEEQVEAAVAGALLKQGGGVHLRALWGGSTLFHVDDLPFKLEAMPSSYAEFRDALQRARIRPAAEPPTTIKALPLDCSVEPGELPTMQQLGFSPEALLSAPRPLSSQPTSRVGLGAAGLRGGETEALQHLRTFIAGMQSAPKASAAAQTGAQGVLGSSLASSSGSSSSLQGTGASHAAAGPVFSCKISPWLAMGCLSPRQMYAEVQRQLGHEGSMQAGGSSWLLFELLWRDFFRFITRKYSAMGMTSGSRTAGGKQQTGALSPVFA